jgi:DNA (cytosine-5)-methyltransferase 1
MGEGAPDRARRRAYGVKLVRGPFVKLLPHSEECSESEFLGYAARLRKQGHRLAADLFSGAGGLSLGLESAGYRVVIGVDRDPEATETHRHHFGGLTVNWDLGDAERVSRVAQLIKDAEVELLAGGPPCQPFSRAGRSKIRHRVLQGFNDPSEERRHLWRSFLEVVTIAQPAAVLMENVPDMALDKDMFILRTIVHELESLGYAVEERVVDTSQYGVPQFRQRLILVALRGRTAFRWPAPLPDRVTVANAIDDLPPVKGGERPEGGADGWTPYGGPRSEFQRRMRAGIDSEHADRVYDQITRPVREDDEIAFQHMNSNTRYSDLPPHLRRYRADIFDDKYKRLDGDGLSRTITAHIAKDGYWYIHPNQNRTLTVREAARLQTFPDRYRFAGPPSAAFRQIGNAVPPLLGEQLGIAVRSSLDEAISAELSSTGTGKALAHWFRERPNMVVPWLRASTRWQVISAEILLERLGNQQLKWMWPLIRKWEKPTDTLAAADELTKIAGLVDRGGRAKRLLGIAERVADAPQELDSDRTIRAVLKGNDAVTDLAVLAVPSNVDDDDSEEPVLVGRGVLRVAARFSGNGMLERKNQMSDGRLAVARMIGYGDYARHAHLGLIELAAALCRPEAPACYRCPLTATCAFPYERRQPVLSLLGDDGSRIKAEGSDHARVQPRQFCDDAAECFILASLDSG